MLAWRSPSGADEAGLGVGKSRRVKADKHQPDPDN